MLANNATTLTSSSSRQRQHQRNPSQCVPAKVRLLWRSFLRHAKEAPPMASVSVVGSTMLRLVNCLDGDGRPTELTSSRQHEWHIRAPKNDTKEKLAARKVTEIMKQQSTRGRASNYWVTEASTGELLHVIEISPTCGPCQGKWRVISSWSPQVDKLCILCVPLKKHGWPNFGALVLSLSVDNERN